MNKNMFIVDTPKMKAKIQNLILNTMNLNIVKNWAGKKVSNVTTCNSKWKYYDREYMSFL